MLCIQIRMWRESLLKYRTQIKTIISKDIIKIIDKKDKIIYYIYYMILGCTLYNIIIIIYNRNLYWQFENINLII